MRIVVIYTRAAPTLHRNFAVPTSPEVSLAGTINCGLLDEIEVRRARGRDSRSFALWWIKTYPIGGHQGSGPLLVRLPAEEKMSRKIKSTVSRSHEEATVESFRKDPAFAAEYLNAVLEDGDQEELMVALRRMSEAFGGVQKLAGRAKLNANTLYRTLSPKGNPELKSLR